jgi:mono/diheme cytochrome c family protein
MSFRKVLAGAMLASFALSGCTGRDIIAMHKHPEQPEASLSTPASAAPFKGPAVAATSDYPKDTNAPRPQPPAEFASLRNPLTPTPNNLAKGKALFDANCAICHGAGGAGNGSAGASLNPKPADFRTSIHTALPDGYWFWRLTKGGQVSPFSAAGSAMPPWETSLTAEQRWLVILYERSFGAKK